MKRFRSFIILLLILSVKPAFGGVNIREIAKWQNVNNDMMINTKDVSIKEGIIYLYIKNKNYQAVEFILDCKDLIGKEKFKNIQTNWEPIRTKGPKFEIAKNLCYLTSVKGYTRERKRPNWAKKIINNFSNINNNDFANSENLKNRSILDKKENINPKKKTFTFQ